MLRIRIICVGKLKEQFYTDAANEYIKRLSGYCKPEIVEIPEYRLRVGGSSRSVAMGPGSGISGSESSLENTSGYSSQIAIALQKERDTIMGNIPDGATTIALCVEGRQIDSQGLSDLINNYAGRGASRLCFIIGGSHGLHEDLKNSAALMLSMSKMTFPHNLARVMLLEQLYRAFKITEGGKYHK